MPHPPIQEDVVWTEDGVSGKDDESFFRSRVDTLHVQHGRLEHIL